MPELGEVREFATGFAESVSVAPGVYMGRMQTVQKIWTGHKWAAHGTIEAAATLAALADEGRSTGPRENGQRLNAAFRQFAPESEQPKVNVREFVQGTDTKDIGR